MTEAERLVPRSVVTRIAGKGMRPFEIRTIKQGLGIGVALSSTTANTIAYLQEENR